MADSISFGFSDLAKQASLQPKEALLEINHPNQALYIGIPKETTLQEHRISLTPSSVQLLVDNGNEVWIETNAGKQANFLDKEYSEAGAKICYDVNEVYKADIIVKVEPPTPEEVQLLSPDKLLISALQHGAKSESYIRSMMQKKINAIAFEYLKDKDGIFPIVRSLSEIAGITAISIASELLSTRGGGKGEMLGGVSGIPPTEIVIIGAGTVGEYAARTAIGKGASVKVFDHSLAKLRRLQSNLGQNIFTSLIHPKILQKALINADVAIGCIRSEEGRSPIIVSEELVSNMKESSVILDISIDQGGVFETSEITSHAKPTFVKHGVIHYCVPNITSNVCRTASYALSNILTPLLLRIAESKNFGEFLYANAEVRNGVYIYKGNLTHQHLGKRLSIYQKDLDLLLAAHT
ncbi:MAG: alanine dehydrogenase [Bacteroidia bacterium]|nr:alanine dehydrogenase [Bacteroidia bacterium]MCF8427493.1 alanine dehydrogenase [Bacteroidia bacterium]MCF8447924.1 alanine dehydrogenase [Bacteroidia bacterium]